MATQTVTLSMSQEALDQLDRAAEDLHLDRSTIVNRALDEYLSLPRYSEEEVRRSLAEAKAGLTIPLEDVIAEFDTWDQED